jgi:hypothetical protein
MERSKPLEGAAYDKSFFLSALKGAGEALRLWRSRRRAANMVVELSPDQHLDFGIEAAGLDMPFFELPQGLMDKLMSMR